MVPVSLPPPQGHSVSPLPCGAISRLLTSEAESAFIPSKPQEEVTTRKEGRLSENFSELIEGTKPHIQESQEFPNKRSKKKCTLYVSKTA